MTNQSKYARAIEAIRTQHFYHREWADAIKHIEEMPWGPMDLEGAIRAFKYNFPNWWYRIADCSVSADATIAPELAAVEALPFEIEQGGVFDDGFEYDGRYDTDHAPSPAKSLLIVMLMALEQMDKQEAQS